jgi:hypothetical protein
MTWFYPGATGSGGLWAQRHTRVPGFRGGRPATHALHTHTGTPPQAGEELLPGSQYIEYVAASGRHEESFRTISS